MFVLSFLHGCYSSRLQLSATNQHLICWSITLENNDCNKTKNFKRDENQGVTAMCKLQGIKKEGASEECNKGTDWSAEVLDFATTS